MRKKLKKKANALTLISSNFQVELCNVIYSRLLGKGMLITK